MDHSEFRIIVAALLIGFVVHRGYYTRKMQHTAAAVREQPVLGRASQIANLLALPAFVATLIYVLVPVWLAWAGLPLPLWSRWLGVAVALAGFVLLQWSQQTLGANWSDAPKLLEGQELVTQGPYRWIRHPIYTAFLLILGSLLLITANWLVGVMWIAMTGLDVAARMKAEEGLMLGQFGEPYRDYLRRTGRLLPRISVR
jgi:protein-S-isoprenylcysteine O-methyltransferase Ste14